MNAVLHYAAPWWCKLEVGRWPVGYVE